MENEEVMMVELMDEEGNATLFEHITTVMYREDEYVILAPVGEEEDISVILKLIPGEEEDELEAVEDDDILEAVYKLYVEQMENTED